MKEAEVRTKLELQTPFRIKSLPKFNNDYDTKTRQVFITKYLTNDQIIATAGEAKIHKLSFIDYLTKKNDPKYIESMQEGNLTFEEMKINVKAYIKSHKISLKFLNKTFYKTKNPKEKEMQTVILKNIVKKFKDVSALSKILGVSYDRLYKTKKNQR